MAKYNPNLKDPRTLRRLESAWRYSSANLSTTRARQWSTRQIDVWFGQQQNPLSKWLREQLLIIDCHYYNAQLGTAKKYLLNQDGYITLGCMLGKLTNSTPNTTQVLDAKLSAVDALHGATIESGVFEYKTKSSRMWNDIQNIATEIRKPLFANYGYIHEYDIQTASPTILVQLAKRSGLTRPVTVIEDYLKDKDYHRQRLANLLEVDAKVVKQLITAKFAGARFGARNSILDQLGGRWILHNRLQQDQWFAVDLAKDIKKLWDAIKQDQQLSLMNSRTKWGIYFQEELKVMRVVHKFLDKQGIQYFHEHDGWRSTQSISVRELQLLIERQTGYWIEFDYEVFERHVDDYVERTDY
jgi:hypothetical protein